MRKYLHCRNSIITFVVIFSFTEILVVDHITRRYRSTWRYKDQGPVSISDKTSYHKILQSLEAATFVLILLRSFWYLTDTSATMLPMCLSNFKAMRQFKLPISRLRDFTRSYDKTSYSILKAIFIPCFRLSIFLSHGSMVKYKCSRWPTRSRY